MGSNLNALGISAVAVGNVPYVFEFDSSELLYANSYNGSSWTGWVHVSSQSSDGTSAISAVNAGGTPGVFEINQMNKVYYDSFNGSTWSGWTHVSSQTSDLHSDLGDDLGNWHAGRLRNQPVEQPLL